jgi:hypothetical protein
VPNGKSVDVEMGDTLVAIGVGLVQVALGILGAYVSLRPPSKERHGRFVIAFIALGLAGVALIGWQAKRSGDTQKALLGINRDIGTRVEDLQKGAARSAPRPWVAISEGGVFILAKEDHQNLRLEPVYFSMNPFQVRLVVPVRNSGDAPALGVWLDVWATTDPTTMRNPQFCDLVAKRMVEQIKTSAATEGHVLMSGQTTTFLTIPSTGKPYEPAQPLDASGKYVWLFACIFYHDQSLTLHLSQTCHVVNPAPAGVAPRILSCSVGNKAY